MGQERGDAQPVGASGTVTPRCAAAPGPPPCAPASRAAAHLLRRAVPHLPRLLDRALERGQLAGQRVEVLVQPLLVGAAGGGRGAGAADAAVLLLRLLLLLMLRQVGQLHLREHVPAGGGQVRGRVVAGGRRRGLLH